MRSLHVNFSRSWGGLEKNSYDLAVNLHRAGHEILFACRKGFPIERELAANGIPHIAFDNIIAYVDLRVMGALWRIIRTKNFKVVQVTHTEDLGLVTPVAAFLRDVKVFLWLQMFVPGPKKDLYHRFEYRHISKLFVCSPVLGEAALKNLPITDKQLSIVAYGLDTGIYHPARDDAFRQTLGFNTGDRVLGILGRLDALKGQMEAVRAMPAVLKKHPEARLLLVGDETVHAGVVGEKKRLEDEIARLGIADKVKFLGDQRGAQQARVLNCFDVFLSPSHFETCSTSMMMAELCAIPIIGTNAGGTPAQLGYGKYGTLVEPKDHASLAEGVNRVLDGMEEMKNKARENLQGALDRYEKGAVMKKVLALYAETPVRL